MAAQQSTAAAQQQPPPPPQGPQVSARVRQLLESMGVEEWEPRVVHLLVDFLNRYVSDTLQDAQTYSEHAGKPAERVELEDVMLATQARTAFAFTQPPDQDEIARLASVVNDKEMPRFPGHKPGLLLPEDGLLGQAYQFQHQ